MTDEELIAGLKHIGKRVSLPCPDGLEGCLVHHFGIETDPVAARAIDRIEALTAALIKIREHNNTYGGSSYILRIIEAALEKQPCPMKN
jgi:hypothetical protein